MHAPSLFLEFHHTITYFNSQYWLKLKTNKQISVNGQVGTHSPNISTTPITAMGCRQCLPLSVVQLKGKHCRKPHCRNGIVDTFGQWLKTLAVNKGAQLLQLAWTWARQQCLELLHLLSSPRHYLASPYSKFERGLCLALIQRGAWGMMNFYCSHCVLYLSTVVYILYYSKS